MTIRIIHFDMDDIFAKQREEARRKMVEREKEEPGGEPTETGGGGAGVRGGRDEGEGNLEKRR